MTEAEKQRAGFAQLVQAVEALKSLVARSQLDPMELRGVEIDDKAVTAVLPPNLSRQVFNAVLNTLGQACEQGAKIGLPPVEAVRRSSIIIPSQEFRP